jgi:hypothetical protein
MKSLKQIPDGLQLPIFDRFVSGRPNSWAGMSISWRKNASDIQPVFIDSFSSGRSDEPGVVVLFGASYDLLDGEFDGESLGEGHFLEFFVFLKHTSRDWAHFRLVQGAGVVFSSGSERNDYLPIDGMRVEDVAFVEKPPRWNSPSSAIWPTKDGVPMVFVGQVTFPKKRAGAECLTSNCTVYLFMTSASGVSVFKLVEQRLNVQTAEDHYASEG